MTRLLEDITSQTQALASSLDFTVGPGREALGAAARLLRGAAHIYITGMGSSMHAGLAVQAMLLERARPSCWVDSSELLLAGARFAPNSVALILSRSGKSIEVVRAAQAAKEQGIQVIAITNAPDSPLAQAATVLLPMHVPFDHTVSIMTYIAASFVGCLLVKHAFDGLPDNFVSALRDSILDVEMRIPAWSEQLDTAEWLSPDHVPYFLGRGVSLSSALECQMLWEEAAKAPASSMTTGEFRHGPQEIIVPGSRVALFIHGEHYRDTDLAIARELDTLGAKVMLIGQLLPGEAPGLVFEVPPIDPDFQFVTEGVPVQLAAERTARLRGSDPDSFRFCSFVVETEEGITKK
jgi:glucosamine--fructose-6-phosphate aminotransferase (isomerizing)